jgi:hypothetical protein
MTNMEARFFFMIFYEMCTCMPFKLVSYLNLYVSFEFVSSLNLYVFLNMYAI